jgi:hypothetical protein
VKYMVFAVTVTLNPVGHPPNYIKEITVTAPGGQTFPIDPEKHLSHSDKAFYLSLPETDFKNDIIPSGTYSAKVVHSNGAAITDRDDIQALFLRVPKTTSPTAGTPVSDSTPRFEWDPVAGAKFYEIRLYQGSNGWGEPVFQW